MSQVAPATHEADAWLYYGPVDRLGSSATDYDGLDPYWALSNLLFNEFDGYEKLEGVEIDGERFDIRMNYSESGIAPRATDSVDSDVLYEIDINLSGDGERKCNYNISPRFDAMRKPDGESLTFPFHHSAADEGVSVHCQPSNVGLDELPTLFARAIFELADAAGQGFYHGYFEAPFDGYLTALERYVRISRTMNEKLIQTGGVLDRMTMLLSDAEGSAGEYKWDNEDERGHHHSVKHGSTGARELIQHHSLGGQVKSYLPENPENFEEGDIMYYPKVGTKFVKARTSTGSVPWGKRDEVVRELDERLLSILSWADVPTAAGGTTFIPDWHFEAEAAADAVSVHDDPLPQLEAQQEHLLMTVLRDMTPADEAFAETVATDGGMHVDELTDETGYSRSELYRALKRMPDLLKSENGHVQFTSEKLRQELCSLIESVEHGIESAVDRAAKIVDMDLRQSASSAFDRWLAKYGAEVDWPDHDAESPIVRIDTVLSELRSTGRPLVEDVIQEMMVAWRKDGRSPTTLLTAMAEVSVDGREETYRVEALR